MQALSSSRKGIKAQAGYGAISNEAPVLSLPIEIACLIFREAHLAIEANREDDQIRVHLTEVAISHVCQQWRSTAIGLPILWSSFYYHGPSATYTTLRRFEMYLKRSRSHTLELVMDFRQPIRDWELNVAVLDMALTAVSRWRLVFIFSLDTTSNFIRLKLKELHAPHLEHLTLFPNVSFDSGVNLTLKHSIGPHICGRRSEAQISLGRYVSAQSLSTSALSSDDASHRKRQDEFSILTGHPPGHPHSVQSGELVHVRDVVREHQRNGGHAGSRPSNTNEAPQAFATKR